MIFHITKEQWLRWRGSTKIFLFMSFFVYIIYLLSTPERILPWENNLVVFLMKPFFRETSCMKAVREKVKNSVSDFILKSICPIYFILVNIVFDII